MTQPNLPSETVTVRVPFHIRKRGGRKGGDSDGAKKRRRFA